MNKDQKIICSNIWKLFGPDEKRIIKNLDPNLSIKEVQEKTGHVVAVKNVSFSIQKGEIYMTFLDSIETCFKKSIHGSAN